MAIRTIAQLKGWFKRGMFPTESQFADMLDSYRHKSEQVSVSDVQGLANALNGKYATSEARIIEAVQTRQGDEIDYLKTVQKRQGDEIDDISSKGEALAECVDGLSRTVNKLLRDAVKVFNGFVNTGTLLESTDKSSTDKMCAVVYHEPTNRFVLRVGLTEYYRDWMDDDAFGTHGADGVTPIDEKIYIDRATNRMYRWNGSQLVELSSGVALGYTSSTAFPGDEGKALSNEVTGMGQTLMELERDVDDEFKSLNTFKNTVVTKSMVDEENGVCPLDSNTQIPVNNLPSGVPTQEYTYDEVTALLNEI